MKKGRGSDVEKTYLYNNMMDENFFFTFIILPSSFLPSSSSSSSTASFKKKCSLSSSYFFAYFVVGFKNDIDGVAAVCGFDADVAPFFLLFSVRVFSCHHKVTPFSYFHKDGNKTQS